MRFRDRTWTAPGHLAASWLVLLGLFAVGSPAVKAQDWPGHALNAQHTSLYSIGSEIPQAIRWSTPVDLAPQYSNGELLTHYGSPMITRSNTVLVPVKTGASGGFQLSAFRSSISSGSNPTPLWTATTDYVLPTYNWIPPWGPTLTPQDKTVVYPGLGGTVWVRKFPDSAGITPTRVAFFGAYDGSSNNVLYICTSITSDAAGNIYFGYYSTGAAFTGYPSGLPSGLARITAGGVGSFISAAAMSGGAYTQVAYNCPPAITADGSMAYIAVHTGYSNNGASLCCVNTANMTAKNSVNLIDPNTGKAALVDDDGTSSPTIGPDGDVYYGVLENGLGTHNYRGWLLHFNSTLTTSKIPGSFGWDITPSIVPANAVPSYTGTSNYLILTKYNNYANGGGNGANKVAILDPNATEPDPITPAVSVMKEVITILGPTKNPNLPGVDEWCINSTAIDPVNKCAVVNSEDGHVYRWNFTTNTLSAGLKLANPTGEAYTPTLIGPDGAVYAINNAVLNCCIASSSSVFVPPIRPK